MALTIAATVIKGQGPTNFTITSGIDLTGNTAVKMRVRDESGNTATYTGAVTGAASAGKILVTTNDQDFDTQGFWYGEGQYEFATGTYIGLPFVVKVLERLV